MPELGVAITTRNRRSLFLDTLAQWRKHLPDDAALIVVDDASDDPVGDLPGVTVIRHDYRRGVAMAKNRCIAELVDLGCRHLWLSDDDVHPVADDWWQPYVDSPEPHLCLGWPHRRRVQSDATGWPPRIVHHDEQHRYYSFPRGVLLYLDARIVDTVGGMNPAHGAFSGEHVEYSGRIHAAGLTSRPFGDVTGSDRLFYSRDKEQGNTTGSSFPLEERRRLHAANGVHWGRTWEGWPFHPYREGEGVRDYQPGPLIEGGHHALLRHVVGLHPDGVAVEFGVGCGTSAKIIAERMPVIGFDSGEGLPADWRPEFPAGSFAHGIPTIPNVSVIAGWFSDTLPAVDFGAFGHIGLVHVDCDLYDSTRVALEYIGPHLLPGTYVVFDEVFGYPGHEDHELKAWREFADTTGIGWTVIGCGVGGGNPNQPDTFEQWAIRIL